ncbi:ribosome-binding factor A [Candidatus Deianiraea vastatrix]|uniref:Uncharacterized protein n=1 Tax=Candidatus Deianiraea vastatrix TaxID=2163644 RepID=A0A5B8XG06_9RICK|nr:ribosome-binding factor A [Candidatus Deianiraea vastatrix]QED22907.1 hypothetical protein Deia_00094 [Candidatus Deianiraea vastatrix]QED23078.1 hypothetical protein Deia_00271 [Candidatus Deianiraea vastatrix]
MIKINNPSVRQKRFSSLVLRCVSSFITENPICLLGFFVFCSRVVASSDLKKVDIFLWSEFFTSEIIAPVLDKKLEVDKTIILHIKKKISSDLHLKHIPEITIYLDCERVFWG